jgi:hypothetical protein
MPPAMVPGAVGFLGWTAFSSMEEKRRLPRLPSLFINRENSNNIAVPSAVSRRRVCFFANDVELAFALYFLSDGELGGHCCGVLLLFDGSKIDIIWICARGQEKKVVI